MNSPENESYVDPVILSTMTPEGRDMVRRVFDSSDLVIRLECDGPIFDTQEDLSRFQKFKGFIGGLFV